MNDVVNNDEKRSVTTVKKKQIDRTPEETRNLQVKQVSSKKAKKPKIAHVSIAIPKPELAVLKEIKLRATKLGIPMKRKALIRASIAALASLSDTALMQVIQLASSRKSIAS
jgi:hypothetical protein